MRDELRPPDVVIVTGASAGIGRAVARERLLRTRHKRSLHDGAAVS